MSTRTTPSSKGASKPRNRGAARALAVSEKAAICVLLGLVFTAVVAFGASEVATASLFAGLYPTFLVILLVTCPWARRDLQRLSGIGLQGLLFALLILVTLWGLGPWGPGGAHPVWSYVPDPVGAMTVDRSALLLNVLQLLGLACLFVAARIVGASETRGRWFMQIAVLLIGVYATLAFLDHIGLRRSPRLVATLLSPNSAATVFGGGLLLASAASLNRLRRQRGLAMLKRGDPQAVATMGLAAVLAVSLLLTASRAGLAATLVGLGLFFVWEAIAQRQRLRVAAALGLTAAALSVVALSLCSVGEVAERFERTDSDMAVRQAIFAPHWEAFLSSPWFGFGLGSFPTINQLVATQSNLPYLFDVRAVHNLYLQWLEEAGLFGTAVMTMLFLALIWPIVRAGLREGAIATWARAAACGAVVFLLHGATDFALQVPAIQALVVVVLGVIGSMNAKGGGLRSTNRPAVSPIVIGFASLVILASTSAAAPLFAGRLGGDLTAWPTAPADALASSIETGLAKRQLSSADIGRLDQLSMREVRLRPGSGSAWLRRATVEAAGGHYERASHSLEYSFSVAPLQTSLFAQRTMFAYEHWDLISKSARRSAIYQLSTEWTRRPDPARYIAMANALSNPAGRVGMALQIALLRLRDAAAT